MITVVRTILERIMARTRALRLSRSHAVVWLALVGCFVVLVPALTSALTQLADKRDNDGPIPKNFRDGVPKANPADVRNLQGVKTAELSGGALPQGLPTWFTDLDADGDGQVALHQWRAAGKSLDEFRRYDLNNDGFITAEEILRYLNQPIELKAKKGHASYSGAIEESAESYRNKKHAKIFIVQFEKGKTYQIDLMSKVFDAYLYLEDPDGEVLAEDDDSGGGLNSRIIHRAAKTGVYRLIATGLGNFRGGAFSFSIRMTSNYVVDLPTGLPAWFKECDENQDGQISLLEWRAAGKNLDEFRTFDHNNDGFVTPEEVLRHMKAPIEPDPDTGLATLNDTVEEAPDGRYRGKKVYKILTIKLEKGNIYQIDNISKDFYAFTYLEDSQGELLDEKNSGGRGVNARIVHRANKTGVYRLIVTSQDGVKSGGFSLTVRVIHRSSAALPKGLPSWFKELDSDGDGQVALHEWRAGGKNLKQFRRYDLNDDGFITVEEILRYLQNPIELAPEENLANFDYALETTADEVYRGKRAYKILTIKLEEGTTYQIDCQSKIFQAFLYLEDSAGNLLAENSSPKVGGNSRLIFRASTSGTYRIVATSLGGFRTGDFSFSLRRKDGL